MLELPILLKIDLDNQFSYHSKFDFVDCVLSLDIFIIVLLSILPYFLYLNKNIKKDLLILHFKNYS